MTSQTPSRQKPYSPPADVGLDVVYLDDWLLCVNKPPGLLTTPGRGTHLRDCLALRVQLRFPEALVVHRLDEATSGLVLFARTPQAQKALSHAFETRAVQKTYVAVVHGVVHPDSGEINLPLAPDWPRRPLQKVDHETGKPARTLWRVLARDIQANTTRLELRPQTGRTHQLRVHMQAMGHAIVGDALYAPAGDAARAPESASGRLMLHAQQLLVPRPPAQQPLKLVRFVDF